MFKFLYVVLIDVAIGASLPQNSLSTSPPLPLSRPRLPHSPSHTHVRITRPQHYDSILATTQNPSQNIQFASSPTSDYYGGSVYSDGNGIVVRPQDSYPRFPSQPEINYFPPYSNFHQGRLTDPYFPAGVSSSYPRGIDLSLSTTNMFNKPGIRAESGLQYYSTQPIPAFAPQSRDLLMRGLGRVLPLNHMKKRPVEDRSGADNEVMMFALGRVLGQLNHMNNKTLPTNVLQAALGMKPDPQATNLWNNQITPSVTPWGSVPSYPWGSSNTPWVSSNTPWWQPSYSPWQSNNAWWVNMYQPSKPWWYDFLMQSLGKDDADSKTP